MDNQPSPLPPNQPQPRPDVTPPPAQPLQPQNQYQPRAPQSFTVTPPSDEVSERSFAGAIKGVLSVVIFLALVVGAAALINRFVFQSYYVDGTSMVPTLDNEDRLIINKIDKTAAGLQGKDYIPKRGDIVVLDSSLIDQFQRSEELVKRVIGLPGDTVHIKDGKATIINAQNPQGFDVDKQLGLRLDPTYTEEELKVTIKEGQVFVMGDNRGAGQSYDSRAFGPVESHKIQGRLVLRIFPFNKVTTY